MIEKNLNFETMIDWFYESGKRIYSLNYQIFVIILVSVQILKSGIKVPYSEYVSLQISNFPRPVEFHGGLSLLMPGLAKILGIETRIEYVIFSLVIGLACVYGIYLFMANYLKLGVIPLLFLIFSPLSASMLSTFSLHDPIFILGSVFAANFRNNKVSVLGAILMSLSHPEASVVSLFLALILTSTSRFINRRNNILFLFLVSLLIFATLRFWAMFNRVEISRFEVLPDYFEAATLNYLSNLSLEISILLWPLGVLFFIAIFTSNTKDKFLFLLILFALFMVPFFGLDQTRDVVICGAVSLLIMSFKFLPILETFPIIQKYRYQSTVIILIVLVIAPQVLVGYTGIPIPAYSQLVSIFHPEINVGW